MYVGLTSETEHTQRLVTLPALMRSTRGSWLAIVPKVFKIDMFNEIPLALLLHATLCIAST